jgi:hypothetical protein
VSDFSSESLLSKMLVSNGVPKRDSMLAYSSCSSSVELRIDPNVSNAVNFWLLVGIVLPFVQNI